MSKYRGRILKDLFLLQFRRNTVRAGNFVEEWRYVHTVGTKVNTYTLQVSMDTREPKFYEMMGYDSLFGSHYDKYTITYDTYTTKFDDSVFDSPIKGKCEGALRKRGRPMSWALY